MFGAQPQQQGGVNPNKDVQIQTPLGDSVSSLSFSPRANLLVATCWDNNVYCWDIQVGGGRFWFGGCGFQPGRASACAQALFLTRPSFPPAPSPPPPPPQSNGNANPKASTNHTQPVLCSAWNADGTGVFTGGCDKMVKLWNLATNQSQQVRAGRLRALMVAQRWRAPVRWEWAVGGSSVGS
jgi:mRNA export factor